MKRRVVLLVLALIAIVGMGAPAVVEAQPLALSEPSSCSGLENSPQGGMAIEFKLDCAGEDAELCSMLSHLSQGDPLELEAIQKACDEGEASRGCEVLAPFVERVKLGLAEARETQRKLTPGEERVCYDCEDECIPGCYCYQEGCPCTIVFYCPPIALVHCGSCGSRSCGWQQPIIGNQCGWFCLYCSFC